MNYKSFLSIWSAAILCSTFISCNETACPLNNTVAAQFNFYQKGKTDYEAARLADTLTVTACGTDSVLINQEVGAQYIKIPLSYSKAADTLSLRFAHSSGRTIFDTIIVNKESYRHYESPECPTVTFHQIKGIRSTHRYIDSVQIIKPNIDYNATENLKILLYTFE